eukprot:5958994-Pyramimonas_sp.AAC.1
MTILATLSRHTIICISGVRMRRVSIKSEAATTHSTADSRITILTMNKLISIRMSSILGLS